MKGLAIQTVIALILGALVLAAIVSIFILGLQMSPIDARRIFTEGCAMHCQEISSAAANKPIGIAAVETAREIEGSTFIHACNFLYPDTTGYPYLCWLHDCCTFELPPP